MNIQYETIKNYYKHYIFQNLLLTENRTMNVCSAKLLNEQHIQ